MTVSAALLFWKTPFIATIHARKQPVSALSLEKLA
jgi:hypothetical protein